MSLHKSACLVNYSSSESSDAEDDDKNEAESESLKKMKQKPPLPLPDDIRNLFSDKKKVVDERSQHQGRVRSFPHEEGNWATHIFIPYDPDDEFRHLQEQLFLCLRPLEFHTQPEFHISLSRTGAIRHHWIPEITKTLAHQFLQMDGCSFEMNGVQLYVNDEKTRSFLGLTVSTYCDMLEKYVHAVDSCFEEYKLQKYYSPPSFHISIGWCLGDVSDKVTMERKEKMQKILLAALDEDPELGYFQTSMAQMKSGNKVFNLHFKQNKLL